MEKLQAPGWRYTDMKQKEIDEEALNEILNGCDPADVVKIGLRIAETAMDQMSEKERRIFAEDNPDIIRSVASGKDNNTGIH